MSFQEKTINGCGNTENGGQSAIGAETHEHSIILLYANTQRHTTLCCKETSQVTPHGDTALQHVL